MFLFRAWPPDSEYSIRHVDSDDSAVPDISAQNPIERGEHLINGSADYSASEHEREPAHPDAQIRQHRRSQRDFPTQTSNPTTLHSRRLHRQPVQKGLSHKGLLCSGVETKVERNSFAAHQSHDRKSNPEQVPIGFWSRHRWVTESHRTFAII